MPEKDAVIVPQHWLVVLFGPISAGYKPDQFTLLVHPRGANTNGH